jgi:predicted flap endonuclease-1-like 5' DNA nuclease
LKARNGYLTARLKYMESAASAPIDPEADNRRQWRMRYLERRVAHLEAAAGAASPPAADAAPLHARIAELTQKSAEGEALATKLVEAEDETIRARWTARYLQARVKYLEATLGAAVAKPAPPGEPKMAAPGPVAPPSAPAPPPAPVEPDIFRMERPAPLTAPRGGAADDLTLIDGISRQTEGALRALGVHHYDQIAGWSAAHAAWVNQYLNLAGRIGRERWIEQARKLAAGAP